MSNNLAFDFQDFDPNDSRSGFFQDIGTGLGDWVEGWGAGNQATADYNRAVVADKLANIELKRQVVGSMVKILAMLAIVFAFVVAFKAVKK
jgi:hypothetical protein